jgi:hypothetical protein
MDMPNLVEIQNLEDRVIVNCQGGILFGIIMATAAAGPQAIAEAISLCYQNMVRALGQRPTSESAARRLTTQLASTKIRPPGEITL